jgi:hypothetical protein
MQYFKLANPCDDRFGEVNAPVDPQGKVIEDPGYDGPVHARLMSRNSRLADRAYSICNLYLHARILRRMEIDGLALHPNVHALPVRILDRQRTKEITNEYSLLLSPEVQVCDEQLSIFDYRKVSGRPPYRVAVRRPVISCQLTGGADLVCPRYLIYWLCSGRFREMVEKHGFTGFDYEELEVAPT